MKALIITVAGTATRFNQDTTENTLKCLYYTESPRYSLLNQLLDHCGSYDKYVIVGGYLYETLKEYINVNLTKYKDKIILVYNEHYADYGSGYSLYLGIKSLDESYADIIFVEGDLYFEKSNFAKVYQLPTNVLTINREPIHSNKAVVFYTDVNGGIHYLYDTNHKALQIHEPFTAIFNSAQIWKFCSVSRLFKAIDSLSDKQLQGTNLEIIQAYFSSLDENEYKIVTFDSWYNCNTVADYNIVKQLMK